MNVERLCASFRRVGARGRQFTGRFFARLFARHPELRDMFPPSMEAMTAHLLDALTTIIESVERGEELTSYLQALGRAHRKFGVRLDRGHYEAVGTCLLATLAEIEGPWWTKDLEQDWTEAWGVIATTMQGAHRADEQAGNPESWNCTVTSVTPVDHGNVIILTVRADPVLLPDGQPAKALTWLPGQSLSIESPRRPRLWRWYSPANAPRPDGMFQLDVAVVNGGPVSTALSLTQPGEQLHAGSPEGSLTFAQTGRPLLLIAQSTGIAPLKAIIEHAASLPVPPQTHVIYAAWTASGLYARDDLAKTEAQAPWLKVTRVVTAGPPGALAQVIDRCGPHAGSDVYIAGPSDMVAEVTWALAEGGVPPGQVHTEDFGWPEPEGGSQ